LEIERFPGLKLEARTDQNRLYVDAFLKNIDQTLVKRIISFVRSRKDFKEFQHIGLLYYIIFIPFFYYLERFCNQCLLHASAIEYHEKGIILAGLGGIGKSTFSLGTLLLQESKFMSDNLIFFDYQKIYSCPEPIALDDKSITILKEIANLLVPKQISFTKNRMWYQIKQEANTTEAIPKYLFWLQCGNENKIIPIDKETCIRELLNYQFAGKRTKRVLNSWGSI
jgi:hypothetical protein